MSKWTHKYVLRIQFSGFRFHGWMIQKDQLTVQGMLEKTLSFVLQTNSFKTLASSRTDAKVSALDLPVLLITEQKLEKSFLKKMNLNLPQDIKLINVEEEDLSFDILQQNVEKEYIYSFCNDYDGFHPFMSNTIARFRELDLNKMKKAAPLFEGTHDFSRFTAQKKSIKNSRTIKHCKISKRTEQIPLLNKEIEIHQLLVISNSFLQYQVRLMMGALIEVGQGKITMEALNQMLDEEGNGDEDKIKTIAPGSGLMLNKVTFV
ncbi:MAG: tRNA pseudouridine(38-40) synthase TruA [Flavobacteriales bacterium]|nr:tRNA pseudouridine(38-40) synthase TruA [Flavobacteriales bacterium]